jgi:PAS domain S-box-containing protein
MSTDRTPRRVPVDAHATTAPLVSRLARARQRTDILPHLQRYALERSGGDSILLFESNPRSGVLHATAGYGLDDLRLDAWTASDEETQLVTGALRENLPTFIADLEREMPELSERLERSAGLLVPLVQNGDTVGLLAIGFSNPGALTSFDELTDLQDAFVVTLELLRLRRSDDLQSQVRDLLDDFNRSLSASLNLGEALEHFCAGANRLFAADRTSIWIHDRRARQIVLNASAPAVRPDALTLSADDPFALAAVALRNLRAQLSPPSVDGERDAITVPLRGCRRALGTLIIEGVRVESGSELELLDRADHLGRQLSCAIESMQLLDVVVRSRQEVDEILNAVPDLVVVTDRGGRIIHANERFAVRVGVARQDLVDRTLSTVIGPELSAWLEESGTQRDSSTHGATRELSDSVLGAHLRVTMFNVGDHESSLGGYVFFAQDLS